MNKLNIFYKMLLVAVLFFTAACEDNLEVNPTKELESEYFSDQQRMQQGMIAVYAKITDIYTYNSNNPHHELWLLPGDDLRSRNPQSLDNFKGLNSGNGDVSAIWGSLYEVVNRANTMLEKIEENKEVYTDPEMIKYNKGEMLFLRSWAFYKLWSWWGKAPMITERIIGLSKVQQPPSEGFELLDKAIDDLETAASLLPANWDDDYAGRVTKDAAYGMLVKSYVTRANYQGNDTGDFQKAIEAFEKISDNVELVDHFGQNFDYRYENNSESLFEFQASEKAGQENPWLGNDFTDVVGSMGAFYQHFMDKWTNLGALTAPSEKLIDVFDPEDPRINETMVLTDDADWEFTGGWKFVKYIKDERNAWIGIAAINSLNNTRILRYADVMLLAAEAYLQTNQSARALALVNEIRERARFSTEDGTEAAAPEDLMAISMQDIMDERLRELAGEENIRWDDLRRWHKAGYVNLDTWNKQDFGFSEEYNSDLFGFELNTHLLMPIPLSEMDNNPLMRESGQNPGY